ncbi:MAG TPA: hypothetical protein VJT13_22095, partial [Xanthobacteraceae bacterium]|nr:hypothetical protein [Xanthobacteraceae bacterium]
PFLPNAQPLSLIDRVMAMLRKPASAHTDLSPRPATAAATIPAARGRPQPALTAIPPLPAAAPRRTHAGGSR